MTHVRAPALDFRLYDKLIVFKKKQMSTITGLWCVWWETFNGFLYGFASVGFELTRGVSPCSTGNCFLHVNHNIPQRYRKYSLHPQTSV